MNMLLAHGATDEHPEGQSIEAHLKGTGELAETFAAEFGAAANGKLCGLAHDIGKYSDEFQLRLRGGKKVDHARREQSNASKSKQRLRLYALSATTADCPMSDIKTLTQPKAKHFLAGSCAPNREEFRIIGKIGTDT